LQKSLAPKVSTQQLAAPAAVKATKKGLTIQQQYARIMQNQGYFAPWSRQNTWNNRIAINNIRKANTPEVCSRPNNYLAIARGYCGKYTHASFCHPIFF
jgi:hypothetical protein